MAGIGQSVSGASGAGLLCTEPATPVAGGGGAGISLGCWEISLFGANLGLALEQRSKGAETATQALPVERRVGLGNGQDKPVALVGQRRLVDNAGAPD